MNRSTAPSMISSTFEISPIRLPMFVSTTPLQVVDVAEHDAGHLGRRWIDIARDGDVDDEQRAVGASGRSPSPTWT